MHPQLCLPCIPCFTPELHPGSLRVALTIMSYVLLLTRLDALRGMRKPAALLLVMCRLLGPAEKASLWGLCQRYGPPLELLVLLGRLIIEHVLFVLVIALDVVEVPHNPPLQPSNPDSLLQLSQCSMPQFHGSDNY